MNVFSYRNAIETLSESGALSALPADRGPSYTLGLSGAETQYSVFLDQRRAHAARQSARGCPGPTRKP
jgi:hypothetical protein